MWKFCYTTCGILFLENSSTLKLCHKTLEIFHSYIDNKAEVVLRSSDLPFQTLDSTTEKVLFKC